MRRLKVKIGWRVSRQVGTSSLRYPEDWKAAETLSCATAVLLVDGICISNSDRTRIHMSIVDLPKAALYR